MKALLPMALTALLCITASLQVSAQGFNSGSDGLYGPMNITADTTLDLPSNGVLHCTTITIAKAATLKFRRNPLNTPVYLLAKGDVAIDGTIDVSGNASPGNFAGGAGGPGGFDGGSGGFSTLSQILPGGAGQGPGGGKSGNGNLSDQGEAGGGAYGTRPENFIDARDGVTYGSPLLIPLLGGSGGGGMDGNKDIGGGGGGGAILIASSTIIRISSSGSIVSRGGSIVVPSRGNGGSGGAIRLVAPRVYGTGTLNVLGSGYDGTLDGASRSGAGRIRIDSIFRFEPTSPAQDNIGFNFQPSIVASVGSAMVVFPPNNPRLDILQAAGKAIQEGTGGPVFVELPFGSDTKQTVVVQARNFKAKVLIRVVLTPASGDPISYDAEIDNQAGNPAQIPVTVDLPLNTVVAVNAWTR
ncbi:MAG: hypothetical protein EXS31_06890 [Pedosphaera sp.]|nr:hypothetical protein [Pedosphaera sp.]